MPWKASVEALSRREFSKWIFLRAGSLNITTGVLISVLPENTKARR